MDVERQTAYWQAGAEEDLTVARELLGNRRVRHGLFFLHLSLEKMLKAHVSLATGQVPPRTHNLLALVQHSRLTLSEAAVTLLAEMDRFSLYGRYPDAGTPDPSLSEAEQRLKQCEEVLQWLRQRLSR